VPVDELIEWPKAPALVSRRHFLRTAAAATAGVSLYGCAPAALSLAGPRVVVVGGGLAGLTSAWYLRRAGIAAPVYEASDRIGGRTYTARDLFAPGTTTELGGEFVNSSHADLLDLMVELGIDAVDRRTRVVGRETYFFDGRHITEIELIEAFRPLAARIAADYDAMDEVVDFENEGGGGRLDRLSLADYLDEIGAEGWMRDLLDVAYTAEYGLDAGDQSSLNFIFVVGTDLAEGFHLLGDSDERYRIEGGNDTVARALAAGIDGDVHPAHALEAIRLRGAGYRLTFATGSGARDVDADAVVLAIPFTTLRRVDIDVPLPDWKRNAIDALGYGTNAKLFAGINGRPWRQAGYSAQAYTDGAVQLMWEPTETQYTEAVGLTIYSGGAAGLAAGAGTPEERVREVMPEVDRVFPGSAALFNGTTARFHWPTHPWTLGSYSAYRPGQWTTIAGAEIKPVGRVFFAGEHTSYDHQGFMNGAAETGRRAAESVLETIGRRGVARARRALEPAGD
jgi:monoamine oxidase